MMCVTQPLYVENNVNYRIAATKAMIRYKSAQLFALSETAYNSVHDFSSTAKELLLLKYDISFMFLNEMEVYILRNDITNQGITDYLATLSGEWLSYYRETTVKNPQIFDSEFCKLYFEIYEPFTNFIRESERHHTEELSKAEWISKISDKLVKSTDHTLYTVYEIDVLLKGTKTPILSLDWTGYDHFNFYGTSLETKRLNIYLKYRDIQKIILKNYMDKSKPIFDAKVIEDLQSLGIEYSIH